MGFPLTKHDESLLEGAHPEIRKVVRRAAEICPIAFRVHEVLRSIAAALANAKIGTGIAKSLHIAQADGTSHAVDLYPVTWNGKDLQPLRVIAAAMLQAADELGILIQWGADWDTDGNPGEPGEWDYFHFQRAQPFRLQAAKVNRIRRMGERASGREGLVL